MTHSDQIETTESIRGLFLERVGNTRGFDKWLQEELAKVWEEGREAEALRVPEEAWHNLTDPNATNPYRSQP